MEKKIENPPTIYNTFGKYKEEEIQMRDITFFRADGKKSENVVLKGGVDETTGEAIFYELLGFSGEVGKMLINGKETYKRLFIQRVYPHILTPSPETK